MYVRVDLRPSFLLRLARTAFHVACFASLLWVELDAGIRTAMGLLVAGSFLHFTRSMSKQPRAILFIDGAPRLLFQDHVLEVELREYVYCTSLLQILHFKRCQMPRFSGEVDKQSAGRFHFPFFFRDANYCVVILPDSSSRRDRRRLRTMLRWQTLEGEGGSSAETAQPPV